MKEGKLRMNYVRFGKRGNVSVSKEMGVMEYEGRKERHR